MQHEQHLYSCLQSASATSWQWYRADSRGTVRTPVLDAVSARRPRLCMCAHAPYNEENSEAVYA